MKLMDNCIARIPRSADEELKIHWGEYWGKQVVDIRWYKNNRPTKGVRFNAEEAQHVFNAMKIIMGGNQDGIVSRSEENNEGSE